MKKIMSLILSVAMLMSMLAGLALSAGAEEEYTYISNVYNTVAGRPDTLAAGQPLPELTLKPSYPHMYTMTYAWLDAEEKEIPAGTVTEFGKTYRLRIKAFAAEGYAFTKDAWMGGSFDSRYTVGTLGTGAAEIWGDKDYTAWNLIERAEVTVAEPVAGQPLQMPVAIGENFEINEEYTYWSDDTIQDHVDFGAVAEAGHRYSIYIKLKPAQDYTFTADTELIFNGESKSISFDSVQNIYIYGYYDLRITLDHFAFDLADPVVGQPFPQAVVAEDAGYTAETVWTDQYTDSQLAEDAVVEEGGVYNVAVTLTADELHLVYEDSTLSVNGQDAEGHYWVSSYSKMVNYNKNFCFAQPIDKVEVTYAEPEVGQAPGEITLPENVNYYLGEDTCWWNRDDRTNSIEAFESGKEYALNLYINAETGYAITEDTEFYVNGEKISDNKFSDYLTYLYYGQNYSFKTALEKVELPAWPELKVGDPIPEISGTGEGYSYFVYGYGYDANGNNVPMDVVRDGAAYWMEIIVKSDEGYEFTENTQIIVGGEPLAVILSETTDDFALYKIYNFGAVSVVDQVDVYAHIPHVGQSGGEVAVSQNAGYTVEFFAWGTSPDGGIENTIGKEGPYQAGEHIVLIVAVSVKPGWWIDPNVIFTLNGKEADILYAGSETAEAVIGFDLGVVSEAPVPETDGLNLVDGEWGYYIDGVLQVEYTGLVEFNGVWFYVENGRVDWEYVGLVEFNGQWLYVTGGAVEWDYTGLVEFGNMVFYVANGVVDWNYSGLLLFQDVWYYVEGGMVKEDYTGLTQFGGYWFYVDGGMVDWEYNSLTQYNGYWFYVDDGMVDWDYVGLTQYNGWWFYVDGGMVDWDYVGLTQYNGYWFYVANGLVDWEYNSLTQYNGYWFYISGGMVDWDYVGLAEFNGALFYVSGGQVDWSYSGTATYNGVEFNVENGMVVW